MVIVAMNTANGLKVSEFDYSNYAASKRVVAPTIPKFYEVTLSTND